MRELKLVKTLKLVAFGGLLITLAAIADRPVSSATRSQLMPDQSADIRLRRLDIMDSGKPNAHAWQVSGQSWVVYSSLYSRHLRELLSHQKNGASVWLDTNPAAPIVVGQPASDAAEVNAFSAFCTAHGLHFSFAPVA